MKVTVDITSTPSRADTDESCSSLPQRVCCNTCWQVPVRGLLRGFSPAVVGCSVRTVRAYSPAQRWGIDFSEEQLSNLSNVGGFVQIRGRSLRIICLISDWFDVAPRVLSCVNCSPKGWESYIFFSGHASSAAAVTHKSPSVRGFPGLVNKWAAQKFNLVASFSYLSFLKKVCAMLR